VSSTESLHEPVKKAPKVHAESTIRTNSASGSSIYARRLNLHSSALPMLSPSSVPKSESKGKRKAKVEVGFALRPSEVSKYMEGASAYIIHPPPKPPTVSRTCLTETYGLPGMGLLWTSKDKRYRFLLPTYGVNPEMPRSAGMPGLLLSCRDEICDGLPWTLFIPIVEEKKARWIYCGEYIGEMVGSLSPEDFTNHDQKARKEIFFFWILLSYFPLIFSLL